jgi:GTP pyrophosphokinase
VKSLPRGATPVDFAFSIHSDVGSRCVGAKVNGKIVPLRYKLKNGDSVEILTSPNAHPSKDWLGFVKTSRAQTKIRQFIKGQQREQSLELGRDLTEREFKRFGLTLNKLVKNGELKKPGEEMGFRTEEDLLVAVGYGKIAPSQILKRILPPERFVEAEKPAAPANGGGSVSRLTEIFKNAISGKPTAGVKINGISDVMVRYGRCCAPVPGDKIVGFITRGRGVTVHTVSCPKTLALDAERQVDVQWDVKADFRRSVTLRILTADRPGLLADISQTFSKKGINISQANCRATGDDRAVNTFEVNVTDLKQLTDVMRSIEKIHGVYAVERG